MYPTISLTRAKTLLVLAALAVVARSSIECIDSDGSLSYCERGTCCGDLYCCGRNAECSDAGECIEVPKSGSGSSSNHTTVIASAIAIPVGVILIVIGIYFAIRRKRSEPVVPKDADQQGTELAKGIAVAQVQKRKEEYLGGAPGNKNDNDNNNVLDHTDLNRLAMNTIQNQSVQYQNNISFFESELLPANNRKSYDAAAAANQHKFSIPKDIEVVPNPLDVSGNDADGNGRFIRNGGNGPTGVTTHVYVPQEQESHRSEVGGVSSGRGLQFSAKLNVGEARVISQFETARNDAHVADQSHHDGEGITGATRVHVNAKGGEKHDAGAKRM